MATEDAGYLWYVYEQATYHPLEFQKVHITRHEPQLTPPGF